MARAPVVVPSEGECPIPPYSMMEVKTHESKTVCKADLRKVQDYQAQRPRHGHLLKPEAQAETRLIITGQIPEPVSNDVDATSTLYGGATGAGAAPILRPQIRPSY